MSKLTILGTSGAVSSKERDNTSLLFSHNERKILVDCPGSIVCKLEKVGVDYKNIKTIFFTHAHPDHIYGIISFLHSQYRLDNNLFIYAHKEVIEKIKKLRKLFGLDDEKKFPSINFCSLSETSNVTFKENDIEVKTFKVKHKQESLGFNFIFDKGKEEVNCVYTGDTAKNEETINVAKESDFLIHDCFGPDKFFQKYPKLNEMHTSSYSLGIIGKKSKTKTLIPIHFAQEVDYSFATVKKEIKKNYDGEIIIPADLEGIKF